MTVQYKEDHSDLAPVFRLVVEGTDITGDLERAVRSVEYESSIELCDAMKVSVTNPGFAFEGGDLPPDALCQKCWAQGSEVDLFMGYGRADTHIGRAILARHLSRYPHDGVPTLEINGYTKEYLMANMLGVKLAGKETKVRKDEGKDPGQIYTGKQHHEIVRMIAEDWGLWADVDPVKQTKTFGDDEGILQPKGMSDWALVRCLAAINNYDAWIDYAPPATSDFMGPAVTGWVLHWKDPAQYRQSGPMFGFHYGDGDSSTLLNFELDYGVRDVINEIELLAWDEARHEFVSLAFLEDVEGPDPKWKPGGGASSRSRDIGPTRAQDNYRKVPKRVGSKATGSKKSAGESLGQLQAEFMGDQQPQTAADNGQVVTENIDSATKFRLAAGGVAIDIVTSKPFGSLAEAGEFARTWFIARKDSFLTARGTVVGIPELRARQVHNLSGLGPRVSGDWYFVSVKHKFSVGGGNLAYTTEFVAQKVLDPSMPEMVIR